MSPEAASPPRKDALPRSRPEDRSPNAPGDEDIGLDSNALVQVAAAQIRAKLTSLPPEQANQAALIGVSVAAEQYAGPLPHPRHFKQFDDTVPGAGNRILAMAEREQKHRHRQENLINVYPFCGLALGAAALFVCIFFAARLFMGGHPGGGAALVGVPVLGAISWFVNGRIGGKSSPAANDRPSESGGKNRGKAPRKRR